MRSVAYGRGYNVGIINELRRDIWMQPQVAKFFQKALCDNGEFVL